MLKFFISIKTYLWVSGISIVVFLIGSLYIPSNLAVFSGINDMPLFQWLLLNNDVFKTVFWIYILCGLMLILWISTLICSFDTVIRRMKRGVLIRVLSPQVVHIALLLVLLGHGISASAGYKEDVSMGINVLHTMRGFGLKVRDIEFFQNPGENSTRWRVHLKINNDVHILETGKPAFYQGVGFFVKSAQEKKMKAIIGLVYDPGVVWELTGAIAFVVGAAGVFTARMSEKASQNV
jgi:cytochrome c biogenesis factor